MIIWKQLVRECLQQVKEPINADNKNAVPVVRSDSHCKGEVVALVRQKFHNCIHSSIPIPLRFGHLCNWKICQPWR